MKNIDREEAGYRARLRETVRKGPPKNDVRITMSWPASAEEAKAAFPWAERLGANELVTPQRSVTTEGLRLWKEAGYRTATLTGRVLHGATARKPDMRQCGYWTNGPLKAPGASLTAKLKPTTWGKVEICYRYDPKQYWRVVDLTTNQFLPPEQWRVDQKTNEVTIGPAMPGRAYQIYHLEVRPQGDPLYEPFADATLADFEEWLKPFKGVLDTLWFDDLGYGYPGPTPQGAWDWESYTFAARPERLEQFERETGIAFDPRWLVMAPRTIEIAPRPEYLRWMEFIQRQMAPWIKRANDLTRQYVKTTWLYWGDCHVGMEPYLGALEKSGLDEIDKPAKDAVTARALMDFPGDTLRRLRIDWLRDSVVRSAATPVKLMDGWTQCKRGLLMKPARGIYWMPFDTLAKSPDESVREAIVETLAEINDEFRLIGEQLAGAEAFTHDINVYVVHSWGRQYSWRPWGSDILTPLTDLPVRVHFTSYEQVEKQGIPKDADVLYCYGLPNTSWSGGFWWASGALRTAFETFIKNGGGLVALQAPSFCETTNPHWELANALGLTGAGEVTSQPARTDESMMADAPKEMENTELARKKTGELELVKIAAGGRHWLIRGLPDQIPGLADSVQASPRAADLETLYDRRALGGTPSAGVAARQFGQGRCVYVAGCSTKHSFSRMIRRAVFWAARREADFTKLDATAKARKEETPVFVYAYPRRKRLALMNAGNEAADCVLNFDPAIFGIERKEKVFLRDVVTDETILNGAIPQSGVTLRLVPNCVRLLEVSVLSR